MTIREKMERKGLIDFEREMHSAMLIDDNGNKYAVKFDVEDASGRWVAKLPELPGVMAYGATKLEALRSVGRLAEALLKEREVQS